MLTWDETFMTGIPSIDVQHKLLIYVVNDLERACEQHRGGAAVEQSLLFLDAYVRSHFDREARCFEQYHCPIAPVHRQAHAQLIDQVKRFRQEFELTAARDELALRLQAELTRWVLEHIQRIDVRLLKQGREGERRMTTLKSTPAPKSSS